MSDFQNMTPEEAYALSLTANIRVLAKTLAVVARNTGNEQMAARCESVADDMLEAYNQLTPWNPYSE